MISTGEPYLKTGKTSMGYNGNFAHDTRVGKHVLDNRSFDLKLLRCMTADGQDLGLGALH